MFARAFHRSAGNLAAGLSQLSARIGHGPQGNERCGMGVRADSAIALQRSASASVVNSRSKRLMVTMAEGPWPPVVNTILFSGILSRAVTMPRFQAGSAWFVSRRAATFTQAGQTSSHDSAG